MFVQAVVPPARSAAGAYVADLAKALAESGADVTVLASPSTHAPDVPDNSSLRGAARTIYTGPCLKPGMPIAQKAFRLPMAHTAMAYAAATMERQSILVSTSDPPLSAIWGSMVARLRGLRHVCWCQDLYPETAAAGGVLDGQGVVFRILSASMRQALRRAYAVVVPGRCMRARLDPLNCEVLPNWARLPINDFPRNSTPKSKDFTVLYSGNLGRAHDFEGLVGAAALAAAQNIPIRFLVSGQGPQEAFVRKAAERLPNLEHCPPVPFGKLAHHLSDCDLHLITLKSAFAGCVVPSKLYDATASGIPVLFAGPEMSETALSIRENGIGEVVPPLNPDALLNAVEKFRKDPLFLKKSSNQCRRFASSQTMAPALKFFQSLA